MSNMIATVEFHRWCSRRTMENNRHSFTHWVISEKCGKHESTKWRMIMGWVSTAQLGYTTYSDKSAITLNVLEKYIPLTYIQ